MAIHNRTREEIANRLRALGGRGNVKPQSVIMAGTVLPGQTWRVKLDPPRAFKNARLYCSTKDPSDGSGIVLDSFLVAGEEQLAAPGIPVAVFFLTPADLDTTSAPAGSPLELHFRNLNGESACLAFKLTLGVHPKDR